MYAFFLYLVKNIFLIYGIFTFKLIVMSLELYIAYSSLSESSIASYMRSLEVLQFVSLPYF